VKMHERITFRGRPAVVLRTEKTEAVLFEEFGAKLVSFRDREEDHEYLTQGAQPTHPMAVFDSSYAENDLCGADDMFPSINVGPYPAYPWQGVPCPDHGELWALPWNLSPEGESIVCDAWGVRLPYRFRRTVSFSGARTLRFDYEIENPTPFPMPSIWAFHPLFESSEAATIVLPDSVQTIVNTLDLHNRLGTVGSTHPWPHTRDKAGEKYDLSRVVPHSGVCEKFWAQESLDRGEVRLEFPGSGRYVSVRFPTETVPYVGIWKNQGGLLGQNNVSIEPATGALDDLGVSRAFGRHGTVQPRSVYRFWMEIEHGKRNER
jgi:galactose mutarotase-like enzyme